jgi:acetolactate synthase-1/3 small subunit
MTANTSSGFEIPAHLTPRIVPGSGRQRRHTILAWAINNRGVLHRILSLLRARDFNIESLSANHTGSPNISQMTIIVNGSDDDIEQVIKQLYKIVDVTKVEESEPNVDIGHEILLMKIKTANGERGQILTILKNQRGRIVDLSEGSLVIESTGTEAEIDELISLFGAFTIKELVRSGVVVMKR